MCKGHPGGTGFEGIKGSRRAPEAVPSPMAFHGLSQCRASADLPVPFIPSKRVPPGWLLHITKYSCSMRYHLGYLWNTGSLCSQKTFRRRFHLSDAGLFLITTNFLAPANQHHIVPVMQKFCFSSSGILLITADFSAPANQNHRIFTIKVTMALKSL